MKKFFFKRMQKPKFQITINPKDYTKDWILESETGFTSFKGRKITAQKAVEYYWAEGRLVGKPTNHPKCNIMVLKESLQKLKEELSEEPPSMEEV